MAAHLRRQLGNDLKYTKDILVSSDDEGEDNSAASERRSREGDGPWCGDSRGRGSGSRGGGSSGNESGGSEGKAMNDTPFRTHSASAAIADKWRQQQTNCSPSHSSPIFPPPATTLFVEESPPLSQGEPTGTKIGQV